MVSLQVVQKARNAFSSGKTRDLNFRIKQLENLLRLYDENEAELLNAVYKDLRKPKYEAKLVEIEVLKTDVQTMIKNCREWAKPQRVRRTFCDKCFLASLKPPTVSAVNDSSPFLFQGRHFNWRETGRVDCWLSAKGNNF